MRPSGSRRGGFTLTEVLVVIGIIVLIVALLLPTLASGRSSAKMSTTMTSLRQIAGMMQMYAKDNRDDVLPSQFNHLNNEYRGHPRCNPHFGEWLYRGTWADLLWTTYEMGRFPDAVPKLRHDYSYDSPDGPLYELLGGIDHNPLRAAMPNSRNVYEGTGPTPFGTGAQERGLPGYIAANQFFNDDSESETYNGRWTFAQMRTPDRSMYLVDSFAGEVIEDEPAPFATTRDCGQVTDHELDGYTLQVDFRYEGSCLMLFLDGHTSLQSRWLDLDELEDGHRVRVRDLDRRKRRVPEAPGDFGG